MAAHAGHSLILKRAQLAIEIRFDGNTLVPFVPEVNLDLVVGKYSCDFRQATPRQPDMLWEVLTAGYDPGLAERGKTHRLSLVELGILKCGQTQQSIQHCGRQAFLLDV